MSRLQRQGELEWIWPLICLERNVGVYLAFWDLRRKMLVSLRQSFIVTFINLNKQITSSQIYSIFNATYSYLMRADTHNKKTHLQELSLPHIRSPPPNSALGLPCPKIKIDHKRTSLHPLIEPASHSSLCTHKLEVFDLNEINKRSSLHHLKQEPLPEKKKISRRHQTIDLWKRKHNQLTPRIKHFEQMLGKASSSVEREKEKNLKAKSGSLLKGDNSQQALYASLRRSEVFDSLMIPREFKIEKVHLRGNDRATLKLNQSQPKKTPETKVKRKIPLPERYQFTERGLPAETELRLHSPTKWETSRHYELNEEDEDSFLKEKFEGKQLQNDSHF